MTAQRRGIVINPVGSFFWDFAKKHGLIILVLSLLLLERLFALSALNATYTLYSDDMEYINAGITFAQSGRITMHGVLSAQIMPGMPVFIGILTFLFGTGTWLWLALKIIWIVMGVCSAFLVYKSVLLFAPRWCGIVSACMFAVPDLVWMDNIILTETPFMLCLCCMIYATFQMGKRAGNRYFWMCLVSFMAALMLKANIAIYPVFAGCYLLAVRYDWKLLLRQGLILACAVLLFVIPWSIRNYIHFDAFVPLTYGTGNPRLLGTYQGEGYPLDEGLDYETNVEAVATVKYSKYFGKDGRIEEPYIQKYVDLEKDGIKANYRISEWLRSNLKSLFYSYFWKKPREMIFSSFYWKELFGITWSTVMDGRTVGFYACCVALILAFVFRKWRAQMVYLVLLYLGNIYIYAMTFSFDRYAAPFLPLRMMVIGLGLGILSNGVCFLLRKREREKPVP